MKKIMFDDKYGLTKAVIEGRKTHTRRICNKRFWSHSDVINANNNKCYSWEKPKYRIGEVVAIAQKYNELDLNLIDIDKLAGYTNKMFVSPNLMPHKIIITDVRVERLQDITEEDCKKEGIKSFFSKNTAFPFYKIPVKDFKNIRFWDAREAFAHLINRIAGKGTWNSNPYVFVYEFKLIKNI